MGAGILGDPAKVAGLLALGALVVLIGLHKGFAGIRVKIGD